LIIAKKKGLEVFVKDISKEEADKNNDLSEMENFDSTLT
jgi:hypothetical protein